MATVVATAGAIYCLSTFYQDLTKETRDSFHLAARTSQTGKKKDHKETQSEHAIIEKKSVSWSLFYNNVIYLVGMALLGFWFFGNQTSVEVNICLSNFLALTVLFFAHQKLE